MPEITQEQIAENAVNAKSVTVDGQTVVEHSPKDLIEAAKHLAANQGGNQPRGIRLIRAIPPGTTD